MEFFSNWISHIVLRGRWCNIVVLNVHAPTKEKSDDSKDSFYEELEQVFDHFPKYYMEILIGDFNTKLVTEVIFKRTVGNARLNQDSKGNGVRIANFATSKIIVLKSMMFPHQIIYKYTWNSPDGKTHNHIDHILTERRRHSIILEVRYFRGADSDTDQYLVVANVMETLAASK